MRFDQALSHIFNNKKVTLAYWTNKNYVHMLHNVITLSDHTANGNNFRPTVTELNSDEWKVLD